MTRDQHLVGRATAQIILSVGQVPVFERRVDADLVIAVHECQHLGMGQAESPVFLVVRRAVRDPVWTLRKRKQVRLEVRSMAWSRAPAYCNAGRADCTAESPRPASRQDP